MSRFALLAALGYPTAVLVGTWTLARARGVDLTRAWTVLVPLTVLGGAYGLVVSLARRWFGAWRYRPAQTLGIRVLGVPIEEVLAGVLLTVAIGSVVALRELDG